MRLGDNNGVVSHLAFSEFAAGNHVATKSKIESGKIRHLAGATAFSMAVLSGSVYGLGLGGIELSSALNQPFSAEIEVITDVPGEAADLAVQLASQEAFMRAGIDRPQSLSKLSFSLRERDGRSFIVVSSNDPIVEPFLNFLVEVDWKRGNLVREYTVLLDPPTYVTNQPSTTVGTELAEVGDSSSSDPSLPTRIDREATDYTATTLTDEELAAELAAVNLALGESAPAPAANVSASVSDPLIEELREVDDLMVVSANGQPLTTGNNEPVSTGSTVAAASGDITSEVDDNAIFAGLDSTSTENAEPVAVANAVAEEPADDPAYTETDVDDMDAVVAALDLELSDQAPQAAAPAANTVTATGKTLAPVRSGQTLWSIASANRVGGVSVEQMMVALLRANPNAFEDGNINALNRGAILRVPTADEVVEMDSQSALTSVNEQNALWKKYRDQAQAKPAEAQQGEDASTAEAEKPETTAEPSDGTLTLVADTKQAEVGEDETIEANTSVSAETEAEIADLRNQLILAQEEAETERQRAEEMNSRVADLESAVEKMNSLLELRNAEMAQLQSSVVEGQTEAEAEAARLLAEQEKEMQQQLLQVQEEAKRQAEEAEAQRLAAENQLADLQEKLEVTSGEAATAEQQIAELKASLEAKGAVAAEAEQRIVALQEKLETEGMAKAEADQRMNELRDQLASEKDAVVSAEQQVADLREKLQAEGMAAAGAEQQIVNLQNKLDAEGTSTAMAEQKIAELRAELEAEKAPWWKPYATETNAKIAGGVVVAGLGLWGLMALGRRRKRDEEELFADENYVVGDNTEAHATNAYEEEVEQTEAGYDATAYGHTAIADELGDETVDATDLTALDATISDGTPEAGNVDILQEADVYLSYGLADRAEELLDGAIEADPNDDMLQAKRLEALFVKQDGVSFETAAVTYHDKFGGDQSPHWGKISSWGAALAPTSNLFSGAEPANLDETQDITSLDTTKLAGGAAAIAAAGGGLAASLGGSADAEIDAAIDNAPDLGAQVGDGLNLSSSELEDALDNTSESASALGDDLSATAADSLGGLSDDLGGLGGELGGLGDDLGSDLKAGLGDELDAGLGADLGEDLSAGLGADLSADLSTDLGADLGADLSSDLGADLGADLSADLGTDLSADLGSSDLGAELEGGLSDLDGTATSLGDDLESMSAGLEDDLEMTDLEATLAGDGDLQDMLDATGGAGDFELSLADEGTGAGDGGLAGEIGLGDLESELLGTDATGSLGGLSEEIDFEAAGLSLSDETTDADLTVTGDEVDTMLDLARAYIDMGDSDSANSTINEIIATGNAEQVEAAKELQSQLG